MSFASWNEFYYAEWQGPWALLVVPFAFLVARAVSGGGSDTTAERRFVTLWAWIFLVETMLDPVATGPIATAIGDPTASTALGVGFVLLGDFRVLWLVFGIAHGTPWAGRSLGIAFGLTAAVPIFAYAVNATLAAALGGVPGQVLWLVHECTFLIVAAVLARRFVPAQVPDPAGATFLRHTLGFVAAYYALWAAADVLILAGVDEGWLVRCVPNQLYYAFFVPFVWWRSRDTLSR